MSATFDPDQLRASLQPLHAGQALSNEAQAYQRYYGLDCRANQLAASTGLGRFQVQGYELVSQVWWPSRPRGTLFLLHGFYDHMGLFRHVIQWALSQGLVVIACDLPGHGLSSGERARIDDFAVYQAVLQQLFVEARALALPQPWHLFGQSTGAAIIMDHMLHQGVQSPAQGQIMLLSPLVRPRAWNGALLSYYLLRPFVKDIARRFSENSNDPQFLAFVRADPLQPQRLPTAWVGALARWIKHLEAAPSSMRQPLIVQGDADMTVDWRHNLGVIHGKFTEPRLLMLTDARHHLANEIPSYRESYFAFLAQHL